MRVHRDRDPPAELLDAVGAVLRELLAPGETIGIDYAPSDLPSAWIVVAEFGDGTSTGVEITTDSAHAGILAAAADNLQQAVIDHVREARPKCPYHAHPLVARIVRDGAVWACPRGDGTWPIGSLGPPDQTGGDHIDRA
jgi:hypothetical protein